MIAFRKHPYEERYRAYEFSRADGLDGLADGESLVACDVSCVERDSGDDCASAMISNISVVNGTKVTYLLKQGTSGTVYILSITGETNFGQKLKGLVEIAII